MADDNVRHTPTPWVMEDGHLCRVYSDDSTGSQVADCGPFRSVQRSVEECHANALRIAACVNACEGIEDPADLRRQRDAMERALREIACGTTAWTREQMIDLASSALLQTPNAEVDDA
jgi:hypothetical protein